MTTTLCGSRAMKYGAEVAATGHLGLETTGHQHPTRNRRHQCRTTMSLTLRLHRFAVSMSRPSGLDRVMLMTPRRPQRHQGLRQRGSPAGWREQREGRYSRCLDSPDIGLRANHKGTGSNCSVHRPGHQRCGNASTVEKDSFDNTYDKDAVYPIVAMDTLQELINNAAEPVLRSWKAILPEVLRFPKIKTLRWILMVLH